MKRVAFKTLGCKVNTYETEAVYNMLKSHGYTKVDFKEEADVYIINTCSVTNTGDRKSRQAIRKSIRINPDAIIVVMGCYAQLKSQEIMDIDGVDIVLGTQGREKLLDYIDEFEKTRKPVVKVNNIMKQKEFEDIDVVAYDSRTRAFVKIQEGCNNFCTFCIIPWARGLVRSQKPEKITSQVEKFVEDGIKEIVLTGIHTGGYGEDLDNYTFANLLKELDNIEGLERIRISSIEASQINDKVIEVLKNSHKIVDHLHIPIQAGSDYVLKKMRRKYNLGEFKTKIQEIRSIFPSISITTDIIVGFPGETDEMFESTINVLKEIEFSELHIFPYSKRTGTPAARMENQIDDKVKKNRVHRLLELNDYLAKTYAQKFENDILPVLVEQNHHDDNFVGFTNNYIKVEIPWSEKIKKNNIYNVQLIKADYPLSKGQLI